MRDFAEIKKRVMSQLNKHFKPEFINRIDDVIVFNALDKDTLHGIIDILLDEIVGILRHRHIKVQFSKELKEYLIKV